MKSASAPPRGGAREPGSTIDVPLGLCQQTTRANAETSVRLRTAGAAMGDREERSFCWEGEP